MAIKFVFLLAVGATAQNAEYPFSRSFTLEAPPVTTNIFGQVLPAAPADFSARHPVCASEDSFFKKDLSFMRLDQKFDFHFKGQNAEFVGVDTPFSHEANAQSMLMIEEEESVEKQKITLKGAPKMNLMVTKAETELTRAEEQLQEMAKQAWPSPNLATDPSFVDMRKRMLKQQGSLQNKLMLLKDQLLTEEQGDIAAMNADLKNVNFDVWYINMNKSDSRKNCLERQLREAGIENPNRYP